MSYQTAITDLFSLRRFGIKPGLKNITALLAALGNPHHHLNIIHIAGTNGKGSTAAFLQTICNLAGYQTGLFTSPHLIDFCERIKINNTRISKKRVVELIRTIKTACRKNRLDNITFFEFTTAMAFLYFKQNNADPVIVESGLGGRLDATNIVDPLCAIITNAGLEHQKYLGRTLAEITGEKAGIIKKNRPLVCGVSQPNSRKIIETECKKKSSPVYFLKTDFRTKVLTENSFCYTSPFAEITEIRCGLRGRHQFSNAALAVKTAEILRGKAYRISNDHIRSGIGRVSWPGRLETVAQQPAVILDGAHNPAAWKCLKSVIEQEFIFNKLFLIIGILEDKNLKRFIELLPPLAHSSFFCKPAVPRAADKEILKKYIVFSDNNRLFWYDNSISALKETYAQAAPNDIILVTGSLFIVGEIRQYLQNKKTTVSGRIPL